MDKAFLKLQKQWYARLKSEGFQDIEFLDQNGGTDNWRIRNHSFLKAKGYSADKEEYFRLVGVFLHHFQWENEQDKEIYSHFADGKTQRETAKIMGINHMKVFYVLRTCAKEFKKFDFSLGERDETDTQISEHN